MEIEEDGSMKPIKNFPENAIPYYLTHFYLIPDNNESVFYRKQKNKNWHFYQRNINHEGEEEIQSIPQDCYPVEFQEVPQLLPLRLNWEYYGIEGTNEKLFREAKWGKYIIFEGLTASDTWKKIGELPNNATLYVYPKYFRYAVHPEQL